MFLVEGLPPTKGSVLIWEQHRRHGSVALGDDVDLPSPDAVETEQAVGELPVPLGFEGLVVHPPAVVTDISPVALTMITSSTLIRSSLRCSLISFALSIPDERR